MDESGGPCNDGVFDFALLKLRPTGGFIEEWENDGEQFG